MRHTHNLFILAVITAYLTACSSESSELDQKKEALKTHKAEMKELQKTIAQLESEIVALDTTHKADNKAVLITTISAKPAPFHHKIDVRGGVESRKNVMLSAEVPGKIKSISVSEGQRISQGQVLATLDADITRNSIAELKTNLELATAVYERQKNLWDQKIGTEIQYLEAKNRKEGLERQLATTNSRLSQAIIKAPFSGSVDAIPAKEGEMAQPGTPLIRIVNPDDIYINADVSERYIGHFSKGDEVEIYFPVQDKTLTSRITAVSQVINDQNRTFKVEIALPKLKFTVKPNQVVVLRMEDYTNKTALTVPTRVIQRDSEGTFVFVVKEGKAMKAHVKTGKSYDDQTEILEGLVPGTIVANKGVRDLTHGVAVKVSEDPEAKKLSAVVADSNN